MRPRFMGYNVAVFIIFFGLSLLDALSSRNVGVVVFWLFVGAVFVYGDVAAFRHSHHHGQRV